MGQLPGLQLHHTQFMEWMRAGRWPEPFRRVSSVAPT
jgi:hypothetical protein